ncbi:MAG: hypothetical protein J2P46_05230 [Zavarzinella sp.]|nr:hypothetical protein [Zavarzinella sp.]
MRVRIIGVALAACVLIYPSAAPARLVKKWSYDQLLKEADLVVLAVAVRTEQAEDTPPDHSWPLELVAQNTTFKVRGALKGKAEGEKIQVLHFKFGGPKKGFEASAGILDGPNLVAFRTEPVTMRAGKEVHVLPPEYLLFLKRMKDGRYEPVSGRIDPAASVRQVSGPPGDAEY